MVYFSNKLYSGQGAQMLANSLFSAQKTHYLHIILLPAFQKTPAAPPYHMTMHTFNISEIQVSRMVKMHTST